MNRTFVCKRLNKGMSSSQCGPNQDFSQGLCFPRCKDDFTGNGATCAQNCPANGQFLNMGPLCQKVPLPRPAGTVPYLQPCPVGYTDDGQNCIDKLACQWPNACSGTGLPTIGLNQRQQCPSNFQDLSDGLCQDKCPQGQTGRGDRCFPNCPPNFLETKADKVGSHCVKPTQGRGYGQVPQVSPLQTIKESPNGSTLWQRYPNGTAANPLQSSASNLFGAQLGDAPLSTGSSVGDFFSSFLKGIYDMLQSFATVILEALGIRNNNQWWQGLLVLVIVIILLFTAQTWAPAIFKGVGGLVKGGVQAAGLAVEGVTEAAGDIVQGVEKSSAAVASGIIEGSAAVNQAAIVAQNLAKIPVVPMSSIPIIPNAGLPNVVQAPVVLPAAPANLFPVPGNASTSVSNFPIPSLSGGVRRVPQNSGPNAFQYLSTLPKEAKDEVVQALKEAFRLS